MEYLKYYGYLVNYVSLNGRDEIKDFKDKRTIIYLIKSNDDKYFMYLIKESETIVWNLPTSNIDPFHNHITKTDKKYYTSEEGNFTFDGQYLDFTEDYSRYRFKIEEEPIV